MQHHLRGEDAERDARFTARLAGELGLGFERRDLDPEYEPGNLEARARVARYKALADIALKRGAGYVATAHHVDDQLETLLMRLIRGTSVTGLRGIAPRRRLRTADGSAQVYAIRPMLTASRDEVLGFLGQLGQDWCEDATNRDTTRTRARLRHEVIPVLKSMRGDAAGKALALTEHAGELHRLVQEHVDQVAPAENGRALDEMPRAKARSLNPIVLTQILRRDLMRAGVKKDRIPGHALHPVIEAVKDDVGGVRRFPFAGGVTIEVDKETLRVTKG